MAAAPFSINVIHQNVAKKVCYKIKLFVNKFFNKRFNINIKKKKKKKKKITKIVNAAPLGRPKVLLNIENTQIF